MMKNNVTLQVILCQSINYLIKNSMTFLDADNPLYALMSSNLHHLTTLFNWEESRCLRDLKKEYILPSGNSSINEEGYRRILAAVRSTVDGLLTR